MSTYVAKYIPIEGEIKIGDMVLDTLSGEIVCWCDGDNWDKHDKKVKLFLCSRDIHTGDEVLIDGKKDTVEQYPFDDPQSDGDGGYDIILKNAGTQMAKNITKVIGEISPSALWVTSDMEIADDEWIWVDDPGKGYILIKCKCCNTFK